MNSGGALLVGGLEALDHPVSRRLGRRPVQEEHLAPERLLQVLLEHLAHLGKLAEDQRAVAG